MRTPGTLTRQSHSVSFSTVSIYNYRLVRIAVVIPELAKRKYLPDHLVIELSYYNCLHRRRSLPVYMVFTN
jgi:hypothetical protein